MKRLCFIPFLIAFLFTGLFAGPVLSAEADLPHVTVYGTAEKDITPNEMNWVLHVRYQGPTLDEVAQKNTDAMKDILTLLDKKDVQEDKIQTTNMQFGENWQYRNGSQVKEGYFAATTIQFTIIDFDLYEVLWKELSQRPQVRIQSVGFSHSDLDSYTNDLNAEALINARNKAQKLAQAIGSDIAEPLAVEEDSVSSMNNGMMLRSAAMNESSAGPVAPGKISLESRIRASFRLVSHSNN